MDASERQKNLDSRTADRFTILEKLYDITDGHADRHNIQIPEVFEELGWDIERGWKAFDYLEDEGLVQMMSLRGGTITFQGIKVVEAAHSQKQTDYFPENVMIIQGSNNQVVQGHGNTISQSQNGATIDVIEAMRNAFQKIESPLPTEAEELLKFSEDPEHNGAEIAMATKALAHRNSSWLAALKHFAQTTAVEFAAKFVAEAMMIGLRGN